MTSPPEGQPALAEAPDGAPPVPPGYYSRRFRPALVTLGVACVALGAIGVVVPGLPTTPFLLVALWAFSRSSERFHLWLWNHATLGPPLRDWYRAGVIAPRAKALAIGTMASSVAIVALFMAESWVLPAVIAACMVPPAIFILTRPGRAPDRD